jgi:hypothetical protein
MGKLQLFLALVLLGQISLLVAIAAVIVLYNRHLNRVEPERRVSPIAYTLAAIVCGGIAGWYGLNFGIKLEGCSSPGSGNLCGLWGFLVTGPVSCALAMVLVGSALSLIRPAPKP